MFQQPVGWTRKHNINYSCYYYHVNLVVYIDYFVVYIVYLVVYIVYLVVYIV